jgi:hypothetical protein
MVNIVMPLLHHGIFFGKKSNGTWGGGTTGPQFDNQPIIYPFSAAPVDVCTYFICYKQVAGC